MICSLRLLLVTTIYSAALSAQTMGARDIGLLGTLSDKLIMWFDALSSSVDHIADKEDRQKLKKSLIALNKSIYSLEENGRGLSVVLQTKPLDEKGASKAVSTTRDALAEVGKQLHITGLSLRSQYQEGGADAEKLIADAMQRRAVFLGDVDAEILKHHISREIINASQFVLNGQRTASTTLAQVINKIH